MPTDKERREVAQRLREPFDIIGEGRYVALNGTLFGMQLLAGDEGTLRAGIARLADLIDPQTSEQTNHDESSLSASQIDLDALLALADELDKDAVNIISAARNAQFTGGGPRMEEAKHDAYEWRQIARRIREALGAQDA